jgi:radical SAM protein with 4Fe4S-binding SPASM domain
MLETNSTCNLSCRFCNRPELESLGLRPQKTQTLEEFRQIAEIFLPCKVDTIKLQGLSEPMMCADFEQYAALLRALYPEAFVIIATNLQYNLEKTPFLATLPFVNFVYLSIDGVEEVYEEARVGARYERLLQSLADIKRLIPQEIRQQKLHINFVLSPDNFQTLPEIYRLKEEFGLGSVCINLAQNWFEDQQNSLVFTEEILTFLEPYKADVRGVAGWEFDECFWPFSGIVVDVYGDVRQCIINTSQTPLGNVFSDDIRALFNESEHYRSVRRSLQKNCAPHACRFCDYRFLSPLLMKLQGEKHKPSTPRKFVILDDNSRHTTH